MVFRDPATHIGRLLWVRLLPLSQCLVELGLEHIFVDGEAAGVHALDKLHGCKLRVYVCVRERVLERAFDM